MNRHVAGALGGTVVAAYLPMLRRQIRAGAIQVGHAGVRPIYLRSSEHPTAFRIGACLLTILAGLLLAACIALVVWNFGA